MYQPLSYQILSNNCWVTSVLNGILCLNKKIPGFAFRLLNTVLTDEGVGGGGKGLEKDDWEIVFEALAVRCNINVQNYKRERAKTELEKVDFKNSVVICDVQSGDHSLLLSSRDENYFYGFDPDWSQINKKVTSREFELFPEEIKINEHRVNFKVQKSHLFFERYTKNRVFSMGAITTRNITILSTKAANK